MLHFALFLALWPNSPQTLHIYFLLDAVPSKVGTPSVIELSINIVSIKNFLWTRSLISVVKVSGALSWYPQHQFQHIYVIKIKSFSASSHYKKDPPTVNLISISILLIGSTELISSLFCCYSSAWYSVVFILKECIEYKGKSFVQ